MNFIRRKIGFWHSEILHLVELIQIHYCRSLFRFTSQLQILDAKTTVDKIIKDKSSISRFGDGEFNVLFGGGNNFQNANVKLKARLQEVLDNQVNNLLIGLPYAWINTAPYQHGAKVFFQRFIVRNYKQISGVLDFRRIYYDALFTRFYFDLKDKSACMFYFKKVMQIWEGRSVFIIEGEKTRMGVGNNIFSNAKQVRRILGPSKNAFDKYDKILAAAIKYIPKDNLVLVAMGMTATVLACDLARIGYQALDIGHLDVEYEWMKMGANKKMPLKNKFVNEANNYDDVIDVSDESYNKEIVCVIQ